MRAYESGRYPVEMNRLADASFVVSAALNVRLNYRTALCARVRVRASPEESEAKVAIKESKRRLRPLTSRLVSAFELSPTIFLVAPRRVSTVMAPRPNEQP